MNFKIYGLPFSVMHPVVFREKPNEGGSPSGGDGEKPNDQDSPGQDPDGDKQKDKPKGDSSGDGSPNGDQNNSQGAEEKNELLREVMEKKQKLRDAQSNLKVANDKLAEYGDIDPVTAKRLVEAERQAEQDQAAAQGDFERVKKMMADAHKTEIEGKDAEIERLKGIVSGQNEKIDGLTIGQAFANSPFIRDELILSPAKARALYGDRIALQGEDVVVLDKKGGTPMVNSSGIPLSFDDGMAAIIETDPDKSSLKKAKMKPGGKSPASNHPKGKDSGKEKDSGLKGARRIAASLAAEGEI